MQVRGVRPFFSDKYDITKHKQYKNLSDYDSKNTFDIEKYLRSIKPGTMKMKKGQIIDEVFDAEEIK